MTIEPIVLPDAAATQAWGQVLGRLLPASTVLLLFGELGAGKTTLIQGLGQGLGITEAIVSPTFTLINEYHEGRIPLYHFDLYRLDKTGAAQLYPELYWEGEEFEPGICAIEWSERLPYLPPQYHEIRLSHTTKGQRELRWLPPKT
ncbi:MAG: tRNA (adenosine(37)-N6)-threonylcarbamoyltransferase complex ATPase subunit type 1 TsaE [Spirulina sp. SIO3F2]|nr:tRNA (adenosine(37)-N6)-threonylcarbamoyltransferase complex ATPase subunit type 1 TsaE [Spirulina sp. SIO3F2]